MVMPVGLAPKHRPRNEPPETVSITVKVDKRLWDKAMELASAYTSNPDAHLMGLIAETVTRFLLKITDEWLSVQAAIGAISRMKVVEDPEELQEILDDILGRDDDGRDVR